MTDADIGVLLEVARERVRQDAKWGGSGHDDSHDLRGFVLWMTERCDRAYSYGTPRWVVRKELVEVAALAVAAVEWLDRDADVRERE